MQIGGYIMEAGATPEDIQTSPDMGVIIKREPTDISSPLSPTMESDVLDPPDFSQWSNFTIKREVPTNEETIFEPETMLTHVPLSQEQPKPNLKSQLKFHLESNPNYKVKSNLQDEIYKQQNLLISKEAKRTAIPPGLDCLPNESIKNWLQRIAQLQRTEKEPKRLKPENILIPPIANHRVVNYSDLPYMGEMTLDNCKPRRGRKPKKADICHLIYKNYGTIIPGNPQNVEPKKIAPVPPVPSRTDVQNKIISSLLEKRLTLELKRNKEIKKVEPGKKGTEEPLNLCVRDLNQLKIRLLRRHDNIYESQQSNGVLEANVEVKLESPSDDEEVEFVNETKQEALVPSSQDLVVKIPSNISTEVIANCDKGSTSTDPNGYMLWPNSNIFVQPMSFQAQMLYYQKLVGNNQPDATSPTATTSSRPSSNASSASSSMLPSPVPNKPTEEHPQRVKRTSSQTLAPPPTKRKRSAIFIPPIPTENQTNPATEVSICKFKFTGGAKPSLQEKKMLSVDSGGNFRYYSGTGDKSMRGYEFFPRETLQQQAAAVQQGHNSSSGVFLNASGEKIPSLPDNSLGLRPHFLLSGDPQLPEPEEPIPRHHHSKKSRKSRKSIQREKLEQTFKEKGFLIQTQQLESAEGATYCKFRQLRKFTRYLFRSWKDYLPGNVRELQDQAGSSTDLLVGDDKSDDEEFGDLTISSSESVAKLLQNQGPSIDSEDSNDQVTITPLPD